MTLFIGLTGGIASGKSTVSKMFQSLHIPVIDADEIAKKVVQVGEEAYEEIVKAFGEDITLSDGSIDRKKLGAIIFNDKDMRMKLNEIIHPAVRKEMLAQKEDYSRSGHKVVVLDIPLLFESNLQYLIDKTLVVFVRESIQLSRLMQRNDLSVEEAKARISSQLPLGEKVALADAVIDNNRSLDETKLQLNDILKKWL